MLKNNTLFLMIFSFLILISNCDLQAQDNSEIFGYKFKKGYYQMVNQKGKTVKNVEPFSFAEPFQEGLSLVEKNLMFGYVDNDGKMVIDFQFYNAGSFSNGIAYASYGKKYGYINNAGEFVIAPNFEIANDFDGDYARVLQTNSDTTTYGSSKYLYGYINKNGRLIGDSYFTSIWYHDESKTFEASIRDKVFYFSKDGNIIKEEVKKKVQKESEPIYYIVDDMPQYPGGDSGLRQYIASNVRYPISAQENGLQGRVYVQFIVNTKGNVVDVYCSCKEVPVLMKEAERVVKSMGKWKPGIQKGKAVSVSYIVPINFALR